MWNIEIKHICWKFFPREVFLRNGMDTPTFQEFDMFWKFHSSYRTQHDAQIAVAELVCEARVVFAV